MNNEKTQQFKRSIPKGYPSLGYLLIAAIVLSIINISNGDPGIIFLATTYSLAIAYADKLDQFMAMPRKTKLIIVAIASIPGSFLMQQIESPAYGIFFGGFKTFLNGSLGTLIPGSGPFFDIIVALFQFLFVMYMILKGLKAFRERDNDEEWASIIKVPVVSLIILSIFDFVLIQVTT